MTTDRIIQKTSEYLSIPSVVGHESHFMHYLAEDFAKLGFNTEIHDGVLAIHGKEPLSVIASAHIDRHGLISIGHGEYAYAAQYVKEIKYGQQNIASQAELETISERFEGETVYAYDSETGEHLGEAVIITCPSFMENGDSIFRLPGMVPEPINTPVAYANTAEEHGRYFKGQLDNTISLGVLYVLCLNGFQGTLLLTTEEEIGKSWKHMASWLESNRAETDSLIILDTSPYKESDTIDEGIVVLRNRDKSETFNQSLVSRLGERCAALDIPYHFKDEYLLSQGKEVRQLGSTELGKLISETGGKWSGATVQIPTMMYHTCNETTSRESIKNYYEFLHNVLIEDKITG